MANYEENDIRGLPPDHWDKKYGPRPDEEGCIISRSAVMAEVRATIQHHEAALVKLPNEKFETIPLDAFPDDCRENILKKRDQKAYELSLSPKESAARYFVLNEARLDGFVMDENEIRRRTASRLNVMRENQRAAQE